MSDVLFIDGPTFLPMVAALGFGFGLVYFWALRRTAACIAGGSHWKTPALLSLARFAIAVVCLTFLARLGAPALLAGFAGFLLARIVALRAARGMA